MVIVGIVIMDTGATRPRPGARGHRDLRVFQLAYKLAMEIFKRSKGFPEEERYSLTSQIRRSSRSVAANIAEGDSTPTCS
jgi:hypothetical protein